MSGSPWPIRLALAGVVVACFGCGLADVFRPSRTERVTLTYQGPTQLSVGVPTPFTVIVEAGGVVVPHPQLLLSVSDTLTFVVTTNPNSLLGKKNGNAVLTARFHNSLLLTDSLPTLVQQVNVTGGP